MSAPPLTAYDPFAEYLLSTIENLPPLALEPSILTSPPGTLSLNHSFASVPPPPAPAAPGLPGGVTFFIWYTLHVNVSPAASTLSSASCSTSFLSAVAGIMYFGRATSTGPSDGVGWELDAIAAVFIGRGILGYTAGWRARFPTEPFATLDRKNYSPLCLWIGAGFLILVLMRLI